MVLLGPIVAQVRQRAKQITSRRQGVLKLKRTLYLRNVAMYSASCARSRTTWVWRFDDGQISSRILRSASFLQTAGSSAAWMPWPIRSDPAGGARSPHRPMPRPHPRRRGPSFRALHYGRA